MANPDQSSPPPPLSTAFFHIRVVSQGKAWKERKESRVNKKQLKQLQTFL